MKNRNKIYYIYEIPIKNLLKSDHNNLLKFIANLVPALRHYIWHYKQTLKPEKNVFAIRLERCKDKGAIVKYKIFLECDEGDLEVKPSWIKPVTHKLWNTFNCPSDYISISFDDIQRLEQQAKKSINDTAEAKD